MSNVLKCCANCKYWDCYEGKDKKCDFTTDGECHRYPPSIPNFDNHKEDEYCVEDLILCLVKGTALVSCPITYATEWCGEFKKMKNPRFIEEEEECNE